MPIRSSREGAEGYYTFALNTALHNGAECVIASSAVAYLDKDGGLTSENGAPLMLIATNDPGTTPNGVEYVVSERIEGEPEQVYALAIPFDAGEVVL